MRRIFPILMMFIACKAAGNNPGEKEEPAQVIQQANFVDPHSSSKPGDVVVTHLDLDLHVDFDRRQLAGIATWNDMWLNEGFTTYFERRIVKSLYGRVSPCIL